MPTSLSAASTPTRSTIHDRRHPSVRDRLAEIRERTRNARGARKTANAGLDAARAARDAHAEAVAQLAVDRTQHDVEVSEQLERILLGQLAGVDGTFGSESVFDNPESVAQLERLGNSRTPIGRQDLGPLMSAEEYVAMIESGSWGQQRLAVNNSNPSIPDTARQTTYYGVVPQPRRKLSLLDLIPTSTMEGRSFDFTREGGTMDADAAETAEGALKPGADLALSDGQVVAKTIAAWLKLRRQQISDVPQLAQTANDRLVYKINRRLEAQIVAGDGTGENLLGILNTTGIGDETFTAGDVLADNLSLGIRSVLLSDLEPNAVVINPTDLQKILDGQVGWIRRVLRRWRPIRREPGQPLGPTGDSVEGRACRSGARRRFQSRLSAVHPRSTEPPHQR